MSIEPKPLTRTLVAIAVVLTGELGCAQQPTGVRVQAISEALAKSVSSASIREFALCHLRAAVWGGYDVAVRVGAGAAADSQPKVFRLTKGKFTEATDASPSSSLASVEGGGQVLLRSQEEAFGMGVPFFISDVGFDSPTELHYTVASNPQVKIDRAAARIQEKSASFNVEVVNTPNAFSSKPEPQKMKFKLSSAPKKEEKSMLSIVTFITGDNRCLASNEIDLGSVLKSVLK